VDTPAQETSTLPPEVREAVDRAEEGEFAFVMGALVGAVERAVQPAAGYPAHGAACICSTCDLRRALRRYNEVAVAQNRYWLAGPVRS
jgi:hypothetical protein